MGVISLGRVSSVLCSRLHTDSFGFLYMRPFPPACYRIERFSNPSPSAEQLLAFHFNIRLDLLAASRLPRRGLVSFVTALAEVPS